MTGKNRILIRRSQLCRLVLVRTSVESGLSRSPIAEPQGYCAGLARNTKGRVTCFGVSVKLAKRELSVFLGYSSISAIFDVFQHLTVICPQKASMSANLKASDAKIISTEPLVSSI